MKANKGAVVPMGVITIGYDMFYLPIDAAHQVHKLLQAAVKVQDNYIDKLSGGQLQMAVAPVALTVAYPSVNFIDTLDWTSGEREHYREALKAALALGATKLLDPEAWVTAFRSKGEC